ncbi:cupin domain-containing protein [Phyllosticta capitalensis]|uniref:Cupin domain-containing protein n=1 Tax=Phyllosticta capitalensis TaxID=121624 RepID=A0ABR1YA21_9PEZI
MVPKITPTPLSSLSISKHQIPAWQNIPNTSSQGKPLIIYHSAFPDKASTPDIEAHLSSVGNLVPQWRYTSLSTTHFHSTTHEVMAVTNGKARLCFGGEGNEGRVEPVVSKGDVMVVPAGVGHRLLDDLQGGFEMVGCYPPGFHWDMCYGKEGEESQVEAIRDLKWLEKDPVYGDAGPVLEV